MTGSDGITLVTPDMTELVLYSSSSWASSGPIVEMTHPEFPLMTSLTCRGYFLAFSGGIHLFSGENWGGWKSVGVEERVKVSTPKGDQWATRAVRTRNYIMQVAQSRE